jgi:nitrile hydratase
MAEVDAQWEKLKRDVKEPIAATISLAIKWGSTALAIADIPAALARAGSYIREGAGEPAFGVGDTVRARNLHPLGHTRLPRYARGRCGVIIALHGAHVFPDSHAHGGGEDPRPLYTVRFAARELWGPDAPAADAVCLDLWEPYLERA